MHYFLRLIFSFFMVGIVQASEIAVKTESHETLWLNLDQKSTSYIDNVYLKFKKACVNNNLDTIKTMLEEKQLPLHEIGYVVLFSFNTMNQECLKEISSRHPYAVWEGYLRKDPRPYPKNMFIKECLNVGFILPYRRAETNTWCCTMVPSLHHFLWTREWIEGVTYEQMNAQSPDAMKPVDYEAIEKFLQCGANPHYVDFFGKSAQPRDAFLYTVNTVKAEEGPQLKALLDKYARIINVPEVLLCTQEYPEDILKIIFLWGGATIKQTTPYNTTDMFYPGTRFYREAEKIN